jgi:hypothetical protein
MSGRPGLLCAGALLLTLAGCFGGSFLGSGRLSGPKQVVAAPLGPTAELLEAGLNDRGVTVLTKRLDGEVRLAGQTKAGKVFCLDVKHEKGNKEKTVVSVRWDREADGAFWNMVVEILTAPAAARGDHEGT